MSGHISPKIARIYTIFGALMVLTAITVTVAFINLGSLNFPVALDDRDLQGDAGRPVLHAREVQQQADEADRRHGVLLPGDPADADADRLPVARMVYRRRADRRGRRDYQSDRARSRPVRGRSRRRPRTQPRRVSTRFTRIRDASVRVLDPRPSSWIKSRPQSTGSRSFPATNSLGARGCGITVPSRTRGLGNCPPAPRSPSHWPRSFPPGGTSSRSWPPSRAASVRCSRSRASGTTFPRGTQTWATVPFSPSRTATSSTSASLVSIADTVTPRSRFLPSRTFRPRRPA